MRKYEETIIIERMYAGKYLGDNIGHEIINTFRTDEGENYIYISALGVINSRYQNAKTVLLVRLINQHCFEVIGYASELTLLLSPQGMQNENTAGEVEADRQKQLILDNKICYGGLPVNEIFSEQENVVYVTFKAEKYRKANRPIYIVDEEKQAYNESYIYVPEFRFSKQSLKQYVRKDEKTKTFAVLDSLIANEDLWEKENTSAMVKDIKENDSTYGILDIIGKSDDELTYSNWLGFYLKNYCQVLEQFADKVLGVQLNGRRTVVKREYKNIDLWIEDDKNIIVIENKIKSGINGVDAKRHDLKSSDQIQSQLKTYYDCAEKEAKEKKKQTRYYIFLPDYSYKDEDLSVFLMADKYKTIRYSEISKFFEGADGDYLYIEEFKKALKKHATPYYKDLYEIMEERFVKKIKERNDR